MVAVTCLGGYMPRRPIAEALGTLLMVQQWSGLGSSHRNNISGIAAVNAPGFIVTQLIGAALATGFSAWLFSRD